MNIKTCHICGKTLHKSKNVSFRSTGSFKLRCLNSKHNFILYQDFERKLKYNVSAIRIYLNEKQLFLVFRFNENNKTNLEIKNLEYKTISIIENFKYLENYNLLISKVNCSSPEGESFLDRH